VTVEAGLVNHTFIYMLREAGIYDEVHTRSTPAIGKWSAKERIEDT
jgi:hypothetical protein